MTDRVSGYCPMGCGATLFIDDGGHVTCSLHTYLANLGGPPRKPGRYRAYEAGDRWHFDELLTPEARP